MACKRSAVRARLAPLFRSLIRTNRTASTAGKCSNGGRLGRRTCVRIGHLCRLGLLAGQQIQTLNRRWSACHLGKSPCHRSHLDSQAYREIREDGHPVVVYAGRDLIDILKASGLDKPIAPDWQVFSTTTGTRPLASAAATLDAPTGVAVPAGSSNPSTPSPGPIIMAG